MTLHPAQKRTLAWLAIGVVACWIIWLLAPVLTPFLIAAVLAYVLQPATERLVARRVPRVLAVVLVETLAILAVLAVLLLMVPILSKELPLLREQIPLLADRFNHTLTPWLAGFGINAVLDIESIKAFVLKYLNANLEDWFATVLSSARIGGSIALALIGNAILVPVVLFYLLVDWPRLVQQVQTLVPPRQREMVNGFFTEIDDVLGQYLRGQVMVMGILAVYFSIGLLLFGFDLAVPVGVFTGLAFFIPYLGFGLGMALALLAGVLQFGGWYGVIAVAVIYGAGQLFESLYLTPKLVGERIGMNPIMVIFALLAFAHLFGFVGVLLALPISAVLVVAIQRLRRSYLESKLYSG